MAAACPLVQCWADNSGPGHARPRAQLVPLASQESFYSTEAPRRGGAAAALAAAGKRNPAELVAKCHQAFVRLPYESNPERVVEEISKMLLAMKVRRRLLRLRCAAPCVQGAWAGGQAGAAGGAERCCSIDLSAGGDVWGGRPVRLQGECADHRLRGLQVRRGLPWLSHQPAAELHAWGAPPPPEEHRGRAGSAV